MAKQVKMLLDTTKESMIPTDEPDEVIDDFGTPIPLCDVHITPHNVSGSRVDILSAFLTETPTDPFLSRTIVVLSITCCILPSVDVYKVTLYTKNLFLDHFIIQSTLHIQNQLNEQIMVDNALQWTRTTDDEDGLWTTVVVSVSNDLNWGCIGQYEHVMDLIITFETLNYFNMPPTLRHFMYTHGHILHV